MLISPMRSLGVTLGLAQRATASGARIFQLLDREPRMSSPPDAPPLPPGNGHVEMHGVSLRYEDVDEFGATYSQGGARAPRAQARAVLRDVDLDVPAGRTVALVGATGSGKTSLVALISRLYDVSAGAVLIDGVDVREVDLRSLRQSVAVVSDDPFLFSASIAENIAYARPEASEQEIEQAAVRAQAHEFIVRLPEGYRHAGGRARAHALGRPAPAPGDRACAARRPARADPRRRHLLGGLLDRARDQARARRGDDGPHHVHHRPPPLDDRAGG